MGHPSRWRVLLIDGVIGNRTRLSTVLLEKETSRGSVVMGAVFSQIVQLTYVAFQQSKGDIPGMLKPEACSGLKLSRASSSSAPSRTSLSTAPSAGFSLTGLSVSVTPRFIFFLLERRLAPSSLGLLRDPFGRLRRPRTGVISGGVAGWFLFLCGSIESGGCPFL